LIGVLVIVGGCLALSTLDEEVTAWGYVLRILPLGVGMGLFSSPNNSAIMGAAPRHRLGVASGLMALSRTLGHTTGLPLIGALFTAQVASLGGPAAARDVTAAAPAVLAAGVNGTFRVAAASVLLSAVLAAGALWIDRRRKRAEESES
ncbi:MAG: MFS transporter, partial [Thermodesulfobacteriota bacterium]